MCSNNIYRNLAFRKMSSPSPKKACGRLTIGTHDGTFHCDEVTACWFLKQLPRYKDAEIVRTRDSSKLGQCDIVVDVGGVYDPKTFRFDHHQRFVLMNSYNFSFGQWT